MIPADTYMYLCCMSSCFFFPLLCVTGGVRQAHQHLSNGYWEATPAPPNILFFSKSIKRQLHYDASLDLPLLYWLILKCFRLTLRCAVFVDLERLKAT